MDEIMNRRTFFRSLLGIAAIPFIPVAVKVNKSDKKMYHYWVSQEQEMIALGPKKYWVERSPVRGGGKTFILHDVKDTAWMRS